METVEKSKICGIYKITSPSLKVYIGQSVDIDSRWYSHKVSKEKSKLQNSIKKHGFENHTFEILEECEISLLNERERYYQELFDVLGENGLNLNLVNTSDKKFVHSKETIKKLSERPYSKETRQKMSLAKIGTKRTFTKIHKENIRKSKVGVRVGILNPMSKRVIDTLTGEIFDSMKLAAEHISIEPDNLSNRLCGVVKNDTNLKYLEL